ncbi:MAG: hypothetical protein AAFR35_09940 [Pseudomonadota bacterium]
MDTKTPTKSGTAPVDTPSSAPAPKATDTADETGPLVLLKDWASI